MDLPNCVENLDPTVPAERDLAKELQRIKEAAESGDITATDFDLIVDFWEAKDRGESALSTQETHLSNIRSAANRTDSSLAEADVDELKKLMARYKSGSHPDVRDDGIIPNPHQSALRCFYRWHSDLGVTATEIEIDSDYDGRELSPDDMWTQEDVDAWLAATRTGGDTGFRDRAIFVLALATAQRIGAIHSLRLGDISDQGAVMDLTLNEEEGELKGATGSRPVLWAKSYLRPWLEQHPFKGDDDAGLFVPVKQRGMNRKPEGGERDPLDEQTLRDIVKKYAGIAGIDKPTYFHILRHSGITRMVLGDVREQKIKHIAGWDPDGTEFSTYEHLADRLVNDSVRENVGMPTSEQEHPTIGRPTLEHCPECGDRFHQERDICPNPVCGQPLTHSEDVEADREHFEPQSVREVVREAVEDILGVDADADLSERADAGSKALAALSANDDAPDPATLTDQQIREAREAHDEIEEPEPDTEPQDWMVERRDDE